MLMNNYFYEMFNGLVYLCFFLVTLEYVFKGIMDNLKTIVPIYYIIF